MSDDRRSQRSGTHERPDVTDERDAPTPRVQATGSWEVMRDRAVSTAIRLEAAAQAKTAPGASSNPRLYDPEGAGRFKERARFLRFLGDQFACWPHDPEKWTVEAVYMKPFFTGLCADSERELAQMPRRADGGAW